MRRDARAYLQDVVEACAAILSSLSGVEFDEYLATRSLRSAVEREFTIIGETATRLSRLDPERFARITNGRRIVDFRNQLTHEYQRGAGGLAGGRRKLAGRARARRAASGQGRLRRAPSFDALGRRPAARQREEDR